MRASSEFDQKMMGHALALAESQIGRTSPNPSVGCVIVNRAGTIIGEGATADGGRPHAETIALGMAGAAARGTIAYVSFEPCAHVGQTPPCADALIEAGVKRVVVGCLDPYPAVRGRGLAKLRKAQIDVTVGVLEDQCRRANEGFIMRVTRRRPFTLLKLALTLDGRVATIERDSRWISSDQSRELVHRWRSRYDAVMVGAGSVIADNPRLTCRIKGGRDPMRIIVDARLRTPARSIVFRQKSPAKTLLVTEPGKLATASRDHGSDGVEVIAVSADAGGIRIAELMRELARRGCSSVMIEGGANLAGSALRAKVVDRIAFFLAPKLLGGGLSAIEGLQIGKMKRAIPLENLRARQVGPDWLFEAEISH